MQNYLLFKQTGLRRKMFHRSKLHLFLLDRYLCFNKLYSICNKNNERMLAQNCMQTHEHLIFRSYTEQGSLSKAQIITMK